MSFMSEHSSDHYAPFCDDPLSHIAVRTVVSIYKMEVVRFDKN